MPGILDGFEHGRIKLVSVVQNLQAISLGEGNPRSAHDTVDELFRIDRELMIQTVLGGELPRCDQMRDHGHYPRADRPPPLIGHGEVNGQNRPRPPGPKKPADPRPGRGASFRRAIARIGRKLPPDTPRHSPYAPRRSIRPEL